MKYLILLLLLSSCSTTYEDPYTHRKYEIKETCLKSHDELSTMSTVGPNGQIGTQPTINTVCDSSRIDTILIE